MGSTPWVSRTIAEAMTLIIFKVVNTPVLSLVWVLMCNKGVDILIDFARGPNDTRERQWANLEANGSVAQYGIYEKCSMHTSLNESTS
jgi:hypothetical protein